MWRRLAGDRRLDALLELAVAELDEALVVQPQPRDVARFRRATRATPCDGPRAWRLREADEPVAPPHEVEMLGIEIRRLQLARQQRVEQLLRQLARLQADVLLLVLVDDVVVPGLAGAPRLAEGDLASPRCSAARSPRARARGRARCPRPRAAGGRSRRARRTSSRAASDPAGSPAADPTKPSPSRSVGHSSSGPEIECQPDHREQGVDIGADVDLRVQDLHGDLPIAQVAHHPARSQRGMRWRRTQAPCPNRRSKSPLWIMCNRNPAETSAGARCGGSAGASRHEVRPRSMS